jgi:hypothetical protein
MGFGRGRADFRRLYDADTNAVAFSYCDPCRADGYLGSANDDA